VSRRFEISSNLVYWTVVTALAGCTLFFVGNVQQRRGELRTDDAVAIDTGTLVTPVRVIDADEVSVRGPEGGTFVVRLLGVKGFATTINEPGLSGLGQAAVAEIEKTIEGKPLQVVFDELKLDAAGRVLAYLHAGDMDVGEHLVTSGRLVAYTRYPFSREDDYEDAEAEAREDKRGLWGNYKAVSRVQGWKDTWKTARLAQE